MTIFSHVSVHVYLCHPSLIYPQSKLKFPIGSLHFLDCWLSVFVLRWIWDISGAFKSLFPLFVVGCLISGHPPTPTLCSLASSSFLSTHNLSLLSFASLPVLSQTSIYISYFSLYLCLTSNSLSISHAPFCNSAEVNRFHRYKSQGAILLMQEDECYTFCHFLPLECFQVKEWIVEGRDVLSLVQAEG